MVVVDDGYMTSWGDWDSLKPGLFPSGMKGLASSIKEAGFKPGVWLAPFAADKGSQIAKDHPEWIIKAQGSSTKPANSANCAKWFYGLDATNPEVIEHVKKIVKRAVDEWGFQVLKLGEAQRKKKWCNDILVVFFSNNPFFTTHFPHRFARDHRFSLR